MKIHTIGGQVTIMGKDRDFHYDGPTNELRITGVSFEEATGLLHALEAASTPAPRETATVPASAPSSPTAAAANGHLNGSAALLNGGGSNGAPKQLALDPGKIAAIAGSNPAPKPKESKPKRAKRDEPEASPVEEPKYVKNAHGVEVPEGHEELVAEKHGKDAPTEAEEVAVEEAAPPTPAKTKPAANVPQELLDAKTLRAILSYIMEKEGTTDLDDIKKRCDDLQPSIPYLARMQNLHERVERTHGVMDVGDDLS